MTKRNTRESAFTGVSCSTLYAHSILASASSAARPSGCCVWVYTAVKPTPDAAPVVAPPRLFAKPCPIAPPPPPRAGAPAAKPKPPAAPAGLAAPAPPNANPPPPPAAAAPPAGLAAPAPPNANPPPPPPAAAAPAAARLACSALLPPGCADPRVVCTLSSSAALPRKELLSSTSSTAAAFTG